MIMTVAPRNARLKRIPRKNSPPYRFVKVSIPLLGAGLHIAFAFHIIKLMIKVFGISNTSLLIYTTLASFLLFAAFYIVVYLITSKAYYKIVAVEQ